MTPLFRKKVWSAVKKIPSGKIATYKSIAKEVGRPKAFRAVGNALNKSPGWPLVPCHRVVKSSGRLGGYKGGLKKKTALLQKEGVLIKNQKIDLKKFSWRP